MTLAEEGTREFLKTSKLLTNETEKMIAIQESKKPFAVYFNVSNLKSVATSNIWPNDVDDLLSIAQKKYLNEIDAVLANNGNLQETLDQLINLEERIKTKLPEGKRDILLCATAIGRYSSQYWHKNYEKWINEFNPKYKSQFSWSIVGKNDVAYGVGGGLAGAVIGGSVSIGILTLPGWAAGAIGGAIGGSVGNAILQLW